MALRLIDMRHETEFEALSRIANTAPMKRTLSDKVFNNNSVRKHRATVGRERLKKWKGKPLFGKRRKSRSHYTRLASKHGSVWGIFLHTQVKRQSRNAVMGASRFKGLVCLYKHASRINPIIKFRNERKRAK